MLKGLVLYYILSRLTGNPLFAIVVLVVGYALLDKIYLGLLPDFFTPLKRYRRINNLLAELNINPANAAKDPPEMGNFFSDQSDFLTEKRVARGS